MEALINDHRFWLTLGVCFILFIVFVLWSLLAPVRPVSPPLHLEGDHRELLRPVADLPERDERSLSLLLTGIAVVAGIALLGFWLWPIYARYWLRIGF